MKGFLIFLLLSLALFHTLEAKQRQPMEARLALEEKVAAGTETEYSVAFTFISEKDCSQVTFSLKMAEEVRLLSGFTYWEGEVEAGKPFEHAFIFALPSGLEAEVEIIAQMQLEASQHAVIARLELSEKTEKEKARIEKLSIEGNPLSRRARRAFEMPKKGIIRY
ncbi:MAG: hypothetical protein HQL31_01140 [Planctomycetes bacterium]|nr:hypothetical protein [Planctomycetota bacterium]